MQLLMLQLLSILAAIIGSAQAALTNTREFATSKASTLNVDGLLAFPQDTDATSSAFSKRNAKSLQITPCSLRDSNKNECIKNLLTLLLPELKVGLPEYGFKSIDPYFYRRGIFRYADDGIQGGLIVKNMQIRGISDSKIKSFVGNFTDNDFMVKVGVECKQINAEGQFKADVKFGGLRLVPKGPFNITIENVRATILTDGSFTHSDGVRLKLNRLNANVVIGNAKIIANGIFSDANLNNMILNLVNENLPEIVRVGIPATRDQWAPIMVEHINNFFAQVPIENFLTF